MNPAQPGAALLEGEQKTKAQDATVPPWDAFSRPQKPVADYTTQEVGQEGEHLAQVYLMRRGYDICETNWRIKSGEVDIIATEDGQEAVLVEVKTRLALGEKDPVMPELAVDADKRARYHKLAAAYLGQHPEFSSVRFDVIAIIIIQERMARLRHLVGAFSWDEG